MITSAQVDELLEKLFVLAELAEDFEFSQLEKGNDRGYVYYNSKRRTLEQVIEMIKIVNEVE